MKKAGFIVMVSFCLTGCADVSAQQWQAPPTSVTQIQSDCFNSFKQFKQQVFCIKERVASYPGAQSDPLIQEHLIYMESVLEKVNKKTLSASDARLALVKELRELRGQRQQEIQQQEENNMQVLETLKQNTPKPLEFHRVGRDLPRPVNTNCQRIGDQVHCTSY